MIRLSQFTFLILALACGILLFQTSQSVQQSERDLKNITNQTASLEDSIQILSTEWDYLNNPERLEILVERGLDIHAPKAAPDRVSGDKIPEPAPSVLPQRKPEASLQNVGLQHSAPQKKNSAADDHKIQHYPEAGFSSVVRELTDGGAP